MTRRQEVSISGNGDQTRAYARVEAELESGRYWRAKEMLSGRLCSAPYDAQLFRHYGALLRAMHDDDEAGRYFLLAGEVEAQPGVLARAFLVRRRCQPFVSLWYSMPASGRRLSGPLPEGTQSLLIEAGYDKKLVDAHSAKLAHIFTQRRAEKDAKKHQPKVTWGSEFRARAAPVAIGLLIILLFILGTVKSIELLVALGRWVS